MPNAYLNKQNLANIFCLIQILAYLLTITTNQFPIVIASIAFIPINLALIGTLYYEKLYKKDIIFTLFTIIIFSLFISFSPSEYIDKYGRLISGINAFLLSILFRGPSALHLIFYLNIAVNLIVLYFGFINGFNPNFGNALLADRSRNIVSAFLIFGIIYYLFFTYINNKKINLFLIVLFLFNCIILYGRSGVALAFFIFLYVLYKKFKNIYLLIVSSVLFTSFSIFYDKIIAETNFASGLDTPRSSLLKEYFSYISTNEILFGRSIEQCCSLIYSYARNPHNSFIVGHMHFGITHTLFFTFVILVIIATRKIDLIFFATILYIRYSLDNLGLFLSYDIVLFSIFIYSYQLLKNKPLAIKN